MFVIAMFIISGEQTVQIMIATRVDFSRNIDVSRDRHSPSSVKTLVIINARFSLKVSTINYAKNVNED